MSRRSDIALMWIITFERRRMRDGTRDDEFEELSIWKSNM